MKIIGIIVEYNPLHNGHVHHFKSLPEADLKIAVMSGNLVNRGEISTFNKFDKASLALQMGVDLIIELPSVFTIQSGDIFAKRAVEILSYAGVSEIYIGSETNNIELYDKYMNVMEENDYKIRLKKYLDKGLSYKSSSQKALEDLKLTPLLPNDTLGLYYYKAIKEGNLNISLKTIQRTNNYSDIDSSNEIASATSIRLNQDNIKLQVPSYTYELFKEKGFYDNNLIYSYLKVNLLTLDLSKIFLIEEGFENSLKEAYKYASHKDFLSSLNTKRYSISKIQRIMLCILFNITKDEMDNINKTPISAIRVLGYNSNGKKYLKQIKKDKQIITNIKEGLSNSLDIEMRISKILDIIYNQDLLSLEQKGPIETK